MGRVSALPPALSTEAKIPPDPRVRADPAAEKAFQPLKKQDFDRKHRVAEVKQRLKPALRSAMNNNSDKPDQVTSLTLLIRALRADLGDSLLTGGRGNLHLFTHQRMPG
jgi:hypothetical protein